MSKTSGFGVSAAGRIEEAFGRYIQEIRANRVDFATFYFDWLCHDNSGPHESEVLANFAALRRLKEAGYVVVADLVSFGTFEQAVEDGLDVEAARAAAGSPTQGHIVEVDEEREVLVLVFSRRHVVISL